MSDGANFRIMGDEDAPVVAVPLANPGGVNGEIIVSALAELESSFRPLVVGDADVLRSAVTVSGLESTLSITVVDSPAEATADPEIVEVLDLDNVEDLQYGAVRPAYGQASIESIERAIDLVRASEADAIAGAPINDEAVEPVVGTRWSEWFERQVAPDGMRILLLSDILCVSHISAHVPISEANELVTEERVRRTTELTHEALEALGTEAPAIAVAGLNPHAGEGGLVGDEDKAEIAPAVEAAREAGIDAVGPASPDTVFVDAVDGEYDCVVAMYHDQGHIAFKTLQFRGDDVGGSSLLMGADVPYATPNHGTAMDIAGEGQCSPLSMQNTLRTAGKIATDGT